METEEGKEGTRASSPTAGLKCQNDRREYHESTNVVYVQGFVVLGSFASHQPKNLAKSFRGRVTAAVIA
jgi:hypothetical protein